jgi:hypothetical protein
LPVIAFSTTAIFWYIKLLLGAKFRSWTSAM